jgi:hypothetical protein
MKTVDEAIVSQRLQNALNELIPRSLDDIIRANRDKYQMRLADDRELAMLPDFATAFDGRPEKRDPIEDWYIVRLEAKNGREGYAYMVGFRRGNAFITSNVKAIEHKGETGLVLTKNSLYQLGKKGIGEPNQVLLIHICATLWEWGSGRLLGVPQFFC